MRAQHEGGRIVLVERPPLDRHLPALVAAALVEPAGGLDGARQRAEACCAGWERRAGMRCPYISGAQPGCVRPRPTPARPTTAHPALRTRSCAHYGSWGARGWWVSTKTGTWNTGSSPHQPLHARSHSPRTGPNIFLPMMTASYAAISSTSTRFSSGFSNIQACSLSPTLCRGHHRKGVPRSGEERPRTRRPTW